MKLNVTMLDPHQIYAIHAPDTEKLRLLAEGTMEIMHSENSCVHPGEKKPKR